LFVLAFRKFEDIARYLLPFLARQGKTFAEGDLTKDMQARARPLERNYDLGSLRRHNQGPYPVIHTRKVKLHPSDLRLASLPQQEVLAGLLPLGFGSIFPILGRVGFEAAP